MNLTPSEPMETLLNIHRGEGAAVTFHRRADQRWEDLGAVLAVDLPNKWTMIASHVISDSFFSINSTYSQPRASRTCVLTGLPIWSRKAERLRFLNALTLDIDEHGNSEFSFAALLEKFASELRRQALPDPNLVICSGRGLWALWLLVGGANVDQPEAAFADRRRVYERVNRTLARRFAHLGADPSTVDPSRVMRVPNSVNSCAAPENSRVQFFRTSIGVHSLAEFASILGLKAQKTALLGERNGQKNQLKVNAALARWRNPLEGFQQLWRMRSGFTEGTRHNALFVYSVLLRKNRAAEPEVLAECTRLGASCRPQLAIVDVKRCVEGSVKAANVPFAQSISNRRISEMLRITQTERLALPRWFKPERPSKASAIAQRRRIVMQELQNAGRWSEDRKQWFTLSQIQSLLREKHAIQIGHSVLANDLDFLHSHHFRFSLLIDTSSTPIQAQKTGNRKRQRGSAQKNGNSQRCIAGKIGNDSGLGWIQEGGNA